MPNISAQEQVSRSQFVPDKNRLPKNIKVQERGEQNLDKNSYLKLLITELSRQDPLNPVNDKEFISQMAQFSALEQMQNVASSVNGLKNFQATSLVGKIVSGNDFVHQREISGKVEGIIFDSSGEAILRIEGKTMRLKDVKSVSEPQDVLPAYSNVSRETFSAQPKVEAVNSEAHKQAALQEYQKGQGADTQTHTKERVQENQ